MPDVTASGLEAALRMLGESPTDVHRRLRDLSITGAQRSPWRCPVNRYVREFFALPETQESLTGRFFCYVFHDPRPTADAASWVRCPTPPPVAGFMKLFDDDDPDFALPKEEPT